MTTESRGGSKVNVASPTYRSFKAPSFAVIADRLKRHAGVSLIGTFVAGPEAQDRRFAIATDARLIPADKLKAESGSALSRGGHQTGGLARCLRAEGRRRISTISAPATPQRGDAVAGREFVPLSGNIKEYGGERFVQARSGIG